MGGEAREEEGRRRGEESRRGEARRGTGGGEGRVWDCSALRSTGRGWAVMGGVGEQGVKRGGRRQGRGMSAGDQIAEAREQPLLGRLVAPAGGLPILRIQIDNSSPLRADAIG